MNPLKKIKEKIFSNPLENQGLKVSIDDLVEMRKFMRYIKSGRKNQSASLLSGDIKSIFKGRGMELEEVREYAFGDDVRDMDWRVTARKDEPYIKVFKEERDREQYVLLDMSAPMLFGTKKELKSVFAAKVAALLGWRALENKDRFGCIIYDGKDNYVFKAKGGLKNLLAIFKKIADVSEKILNDPAEGVMDKSLKLLEKTIKNGGDVFILSDFHGFGDDMKKALFALAKKSELYLFQIADSLEIRAPKGGEYMAKYEDSSLVFSTYSKDFQEDYAAYFSDKRLNIHNFADKSQIFYTTLVSGNDLNSQIKII